MQAIDEEVEKLTQGMSRTLGSLWGGTQRMWQQKVVPVVAPEPNPNPATDPEAPKPAEPPSPQRQQLLSGCAPLPPPPPGQNLVPVVAVEPYQWGPAATRG